MATSIGAQLQALRTLVQVESQSVKRPLTRPSILFSPKEAADIDIDTIFNIALSGLEVLTGLDERFSKYKNALFSHKGKELDRELMGTEENDRINTSISSYLHMLSAHFQLAAARRTLEYLIRRYKIHVYNIEDLILCALPYHDTHTFVQVVQLLNTGNSKWNFLDGVKALGAPPPRSFIVQQCIRDYGVLESLCNHASATKKFQTPSTLISFCTAVIIEVLGSVTTVNSDIVKRILPFVVSGLQGGRGSLDHKAGSLMVVGSLANKAALSPKLVNSLIRMVAEVAKQDAKELADLQWFRSSLMALINLVQLQCIDLLPKKAIESLKEIRDIDRILLDLSKEFNVDSFVAVVVESFIDYSNDDESGHVLLSIIETIPMEALVDRVVLKVLLRCKQLMGGDSSSVSFGAGSWAKNVLAAIKRKYPSQLHAAFKRFLEDNKMKSKKDAMLFEFLCKMLDENSDSLIGTSDSKIWYASHHPKPEVRRSALSYFNGSTTAKLETLSPQMLITVRDVILHQLNDNDLTVVQSVLSLDGISQIVNSSDLFKALHDVFKRCIGILMSGPSDESALAGDVTLMCLKTAVCGFQNHIYMKEVASMIFPLLLIWPQTKRLNVKALELAKETKWPFFQHLPAVSRKELKSSQGRFSPLNLEIISSLVETFMKDPAELIPWLVRSCCDFKSSKTLLFLILMQSLLMVRNSAMSAALFDSCLPFLKSEWESFGPPVNSYLEKFNEEMLHWDCGKFLDQLFVIDIDTLNVCILACLCWRLLETFVSAPSLDFMGDCDRGGARLQDLFSFLASSGMKHIFKKDLKQLVENHLQTITAKCKISPARFLSKFFTEEGVPVEVQVESLHCFAFLCSVSDDRLAVDLLTEFPSLLVPLSSDDQVIKAAAMNCVEKQYKLWCKVDLSSKKNGNAAVWSNFLGEFLALIVQQKRLVLSDNNFLASFLACLLGSPSDDILMPPNLGQRFDQSTKEKMLAFLIGSALKLSDFGKLRVLSLFKGLGNAILNINDARSLLCLLLRKQSQCTFEMNHSSQKLSETEIKLLCLLLETCLLPSSLSVRHVFEEHVLETLQLGSLSPHDPAVEQLVLTVLHNLGSHFYSSLTADKQDLLFQQLVHLFWNSNAVMQNSTSDTLLRLDIEWSIFGRMIDLILKGEAVIQSSTNGKKKKKHLEHAPYHSSTADGQDISFLSSLLDILQLKKDLTNREYLIAPLFELLGKVFSKEWVTSLSQDNKLTQAPVAISNTTSAAICFIQQRLLLILEDIIGAIMNATSPLKEEIINKIDVKMVVECACLTVDPVTRNHVFAVLSSVAKLSPEKILDHMLDILTVLGGSTVLQSDSYSQRVFEDLLSATVPYWLSKTNDRGKLLKVFVSMLPEVAGHRKLSIFVYLLRILGESDSLGPLLALLFQSLVSRTGMSCLGNSDTSDVFSSYEAKSWEFAFAAQICGQYSCIIWLPSLVTVLRLLSTGNLHQESLLGLLTAMEFILHKLGDAELGFKIDSAENSDSIQLALQELMELVVVISQIAYGNKKRKCIPHAIKKELKALTDAILETVTFSMTPSTYFRGITQLLASADGNVRKKALGVLCGTLKDYNGKIQKDGKKFHSNSTGYQPHLDDAALETFDEMCVEIMKLVDDSAGESNAYLKLAAVSTIELLAQRFPSNYSVFSTCLASVTRGIGSLNLAVSSSCLRAVSSLIDVLGPRALVELPHVMENVIKKCWENSSSSHINIKSDDRTSVLVSLLVTLQAVVDKLGGFLNPYLGDILEIMVLHPAYATSSDSKLKLQADVVRRLLTEKIPARLTLLPLLKIYDKAIQSGDKSLEIAFEMLTDLVRKMDRSSINNHYEKIFDQCLVALDVRSQQPVAVKNVNVVEKSVINAIIALTMKLTEIMFRPLFLKSIKWAQTNAEDSAGRESSNLDRAITFYGLVYKLVENHRSLFVPYFKYMVKDCAKLLSDPEDMETSKLIRKKKKAKIQDAESARDDVLSVKRWHVSALILSSLHKCFLHDTGGLKFLESNFQVLVKPIVSQLVNEPPSSLYKHPDVPSVNEVDDLLVMCIGQMAVTAGSDLLWKPLNHEVLLQTRSEKVRARVLGLRIVKQFLDKLKEEYLVLLPETIPFLGELLEDVELPVKSLAQDILKEMESMSGESLRNYI